MKLQQLQYIVEVSRHNLNVSATAASLYTSQPSMSKQIKLLEDELGIQIFSRKGKQLTHITTAGKEVINVAKNILANVNAIKTIAHRYHEPNQKRLAISVTYKLAQDRLPAIIQRFNQHHPQVNIEIHQRSSSQVLQSIMNGWVDFALLPECSVVSSDKLTILPYYQLNPYIVVPRLHPLANQKRMTIEALANYPLILNSHSTLLHYYLNQAFNRVGFVPYIAFTTSDSDVIKTYVQMGLGVGIILPLLQDNIIDSPDFVIVDVKHLFESYRVYLCFKRGFTPHDYHHDFMTQILPYLDPSKSQRRAIGP